MLAGVLSRLAKRKVLVIGDLMLDRYTIGAVRRISPEAPVSVLHVEREESRAGGAGNAILNLLALGQEVVTIGRVGPDSEADILCASLKEAGADLSGLLIQQGYQTPLKNRLIAGNQQIVRVDVERVEPLSAALQRQLSDALPELLQGVAAVAISDYGKGLLSPPLLERLIDAARAASIPIIADPKGRDFDRYAAVTCLKPNQGEAIEAAGLPAEASLDEVAQTLLTRTGVEHLMITRAEKGVALFSQQQREDYPARVQEVSDVTGAGDTVLALVAAAMANRLPMGATAELSNIAAGLAVRQFGCARVSLSELARELLLRDTTQKVFTQDHLLALQQALQGRPYTLFVLSELDGFAPALLRQLREAEGDVVVYVQGAAADSELVAALAHLIDVDFILLHEQAVERLKQLVPPQAIQTSCQTTQ